LYLILYIYVCILYNVIHNYKEGIYIIFVYMYDVKSY
jgi:hypothetical protein